MPDEGAAVKGADWYDAVYRSVPVYGVPYWHSHYYFLWCVIADRIRRAGHRRVLDVGCGPGQLANCLFDLAGIEAYTGLDFSVQAVAMATAQCPRGRFLVGDATGTNVHGEIPHDVVVSTEVLEHVRDDVGVLGRFLPGKSCLLTVPNFPYDSHVRHFVGWQDVEHRYGPFFDTFSVLPLRGHHSDDQVYYLCEGVRNTYGA